MTADDAALRGNNPASPAAAVRAIKHDAYEQSACLGHSARKSLISLRYSPLLA